jgi:argininosuccinate synthase
LGDLLRVEAQHKVVAPWRYRNLHSHRIDAYAMGSRAVTKARPYSTDRNIFHISYEGGILEDPWKEPSADMFVWCRPVEKAPNRAEYVEIDYMRGDPVAVNGRRLSPAKLLAKLTIPARGMVLGGHGREPLRGE